MTTSWWSVPKRSATRRAYSSSLYCSCSREGDREGAHRVAHQLAHQRDVGRRVDAAREEGADRHVAHHPLGDRAAQQLEQALAAARPRSRVELRRRAARPSATSRRRCTRRAVGLDQHRARPARACGRPRTSSAAPACRRRSGSGGRPSSSSSGRDRRVREQRLDLRAEDEAAGRLRVVERLLAQAVARQDQLAGAARPRWRARTCRRGARRSGALLLVEVDDRPRCRCASGSGARAPRAPGAARRGCRSRR